MGVQVMAVILALVGVLTGSVAAAAPDALAAAPGATEPPAVECVCAGDCTQDQLRLQDGTGDGDQAQDRDRLRTQDCLSTGDCTQDQLRTQECLQTAVCLETQLRTQDMARTGK